MKKDKYFLKPAHSTACKKWSPWIWATIPAHGAAVDKVYTQHIILYHEHIHEGSEPSCSSREERCCVFFYFLVCKDFFHTLSFISQFATLCVMAWEWNILCSLQPDGLEILIFPLLFFPLPPWGKKKKRVPGCRWGCLAVVEAGPLCQEISKTHEPERDRTEERPWLQASGWDGDNPPL